MPQHTHSHGDGPEHEHEGATPGHAQDAPTTPPAPTTPAAVDVGPTAGGLSIRILLTLLGAAGMIVGAFLDWIANVPETEGTLAPFEVFWSVTTTRDAGFLTSAGAAVILLGLVALIGLVPRTGWITRLAGALGIVAFVLFLISLYRVEAADLGIGDIGLGLWVILVGGVVALIGGFLGSRRVISATVPAAPAPPTP